MAMTEVAQATVTIIPNMKGSQEKIAKDLDASIEPAGSSAGKVFGGKFAVAAGAAVAAAAIGKMIAESITAGSELQQSLGGIETMFKENADTVKGYASEAYKTAGISANDYMQSVTSFSAALISSMEGDTAAAAELANTAIIDMADNANKMGTSMDSIQAAYQGFAKQNYTMLDNLKLGYGGTKTEMERLLADATELSGIKYDISNLDDVYSAIHVIQENLGITGTTAKEAAETFSGSFASMKAAAEDLLGNLSLGNDIGPQIQNLSETVSTFLTGNLIPMVSNVVQQIPTLLAQIPSFVADLLPQLIPAIGDLVSGLAEGIVTNIPVFVAGIGDLATAAIDSLLNVSWADVGTQIVDLIKSGWEALKEAAQSIWDSVTSIFTSVIKVSPIATEAWNKLKKTATTVWNTAKGIFEKAGPTVKSIVVTAWSSLQSTATTIWSAAKNAFESTAPVVKEVVTKAWDSLSSTASSIWSEVKNIFSDFEITWPDFGELAKGAFEGLKNAAKSAWDWIKGLFGGGSNDETVEAVRGSTAEMEAALAECSLIVSDVDTSSLEQANSEVESVAGHWEIVVSSLDLSLPTIDCTAIGTAMSIVDAGVASMQSAMNFSWSLPALHGSVPSISVSMNSATSSDGKTTVSYPVFNVGTKWFAEGGIFKQPSIIGVGEAGAEAALPLDAFWKRLDAEFDRSGSGATINNYIEINGATDPVAYADELARELQQQLKRA